MPSYKCMHVKERKEGRGDGFVVVLRMWFTWSPMSQIDGCSPASPPPQNNQTKAHELHQVVIHLTKSLSNIQSSKSLPYLLGTQKSLDSQTYTFQLQMSNKCLGESRWMRETRSPRKPTNQP